ncbi:hypothetical protein B5S29_g633 [[Candida] boidinii]|nr:hypothetical protein B5S29_g633 [[Candida] boidinii]
MSLNNQQFPPSSPVLNSTDDQFAPSLYTDLGGQKIDLSLTKSINTKEKLRFFKDSNKQQQQQQTSKQQDELYPTPNPSSSMGVLTSPIKSRNNTELNSDSPLQLKTKNSPITPVNNKTNNDQQSQINDFDSRSASPITTTQHLYIKKNITENKLSHKQSGNIFNNSNNNNNNNDNNKISLISPLDKVKRLKIPFNGRIINIGRSSKSSQCVLPSKNKLISRIHCSVQMLKPDYNSNINENSIIVKCHGWNGINITVPTLVDVEQINNSNSNENQFKISKRLNKNEVNLKDLKFKNRILCQEKSVTNFYMLKNESFIIPLIPGLLLDFRGECVLLEYETESDLTDDEQEIVNSVSSNNNNNNNNNNNTLKHKLDQNSQQDNVDDDKNKKRKLVENNKIGSMKEQETTTTVNPSSSVTPVAIANTADSVSIPNQASMEIKHETKDKKSNEIKETEKKQKKNINSLSKPSSLSNTNIVSLNTPIKSTKPKSTVYIHNDKSSALSSSNNVTSTPVTNVTPKHDRLKLKLKTKSKINSKSLSPSPSPSPAMKKTSANASVSKQIPSLSSSAPSTTTPNTSHNQSLKLHLTARKPLADITDKVMNNNGKKTSLSSPSTNTVKQHRRSRSSELHKVTKIQHNSSSSSKLHNDKENRAVSMSPKQIKKYQKKEENIVSSISKASESLNKVLSLDNKVNSQPGQEQQQQQQQHHINSETLINDENNASTPQIPQKKMANYTKEEVSNVLKDVKDLSEICNVLGNHLAFSRVSSTPLRQVYSLNAIQSHKLTIEQLRAILIHHLEFIGVIYREGKDAAGKPLDEEYYYIPEKDKDQGRVKLAEELKGPGAGLRSCRKTHKQYFWKKPTKK